MKLDKTAIIGLSLIAICLLAGAFTLNWLFDYLDCHVGTYVPGKSDDRFMGIVLEAHKNNNYELLQKVATEDAISSLDQFPKLPSQFIDVLHLDYLKYTEYNYRVFFDDEHYFDVWLEYEAWPECPNDEFTDEEVMAHFRLLKVGSFHDP